MDSPGVLQDPKYSYLVKDQKYSIKFWKKLFYVFSKFLFSWYTPVTVSGKNHIPKTSYIFACNHNSHMDVALLAVSANRSFDDFGMLAAKDYWFDNWFKRKLVNTFMNLVPIDRMGYGKNRFPIEDTLKLCEAFMARNNRNLIMFPEGTRGDPGKMRKFKNGAAMFAIRLNVPILPAFIVGADKALPKKTFFIRPAKIQVHILEPLDPKAFASPDAPGALNEKDLIKAAQSMTGKLERRIGDKGKAVDEQHRNQTK